MSMPSMDMVAVAVGLDDVPVGDMSIVMSMLKES
jgi:hypothetical protein